MYYGVMEDFVDHDKLVETKKLLASKDKKILIYGVGAGLISTGDLYIYCDLARWEFSYGIDKECQILNVIILMKIF